MFIRSIFGLYREGYLHGDARQFAEEAAARGATVTCQGPENNSPFRDPLLVTLLTKDAEDRRHGRPWRAWGKTALHPEPEVHAEST
jgi:hypothetical protein